MFTHIPNWDREYAQLTIRYKSNRVHHFSTTVGDARRRAEVAITNKSVDWIKVDIPNSTSTKVRICTWDKKDKWTVNIATLPKTT